MLRGLCPHGLEPPHPCRRALGPQVPTSQCDAGQPCALAAGTRDLPRTQREARAMCTSRISDMRHPRSSGRALSLSPQEPRLGARQLSEESALRFL